MNSRKMGIATSLLSVGTLAISAGSAMAGPGNNDFALEVTASCGGENVEVVVIGGGGWAPALEVESHQVFLPQAFDLTSTFTVQGEDPVTYTDTRSKSRVSDDAVECTISNQTIQFPARGKQPAATLVLDGTVTGVFRG